MQVKDLIVNERYKEKFQVAVNKSSHQLFQNEMKKEKCTLQMLLVVFPTPSLGVNKKAATGKSVSFYDKQLKHIVISLYIFSSLSRPPAISFTSHRATCT